MKVKQKDQAQVLEHVDSLRKQVLEFIDTAQKLLSAKQDNVKSDDDLRVIGTVAGILCTAVNGLAGMTVSTHWKNAINAALSAEDEQEQTFESVGESLNDFLINNAAHLSDARKGGELALSFKRLIVEQTANALALIDTLIASHYKTHDLCARHNIDFEAVQNGDKAALTQVVEATVRETGEPLSDKVYEQLGLPVPQRPVTRADNDNETASILGLNGDEPLSEPDDEATIRA